jgi:hypothetical protein
VHDGEETANRVIENVKKKMALKGSKNAKRNRPMKQKASGAENLEYDTSEDDELEEGEANVPRVAAAAAHAHGGEEEGNRVTESVKKTVVQKVNAKADESRKKSRKVKTFEIEVSEDEEEEGKGDVMVNVPGSDNKHKRDCANPSDDLKVVQNRKRADDSESEDDSQRAGTSKPSGAASSSSSSSSGLILKISFAK